MLLAGKKIDRDREEGRVGRVLSPIFERPAHRFDQVMELLGRSFHSEVRWESLEDVQHLDQRGAAAGGRRHREDLIFTKSTLHRIALDGFVRLQIVVANRAVVRSHIGVDQARGFAFIEFAPSVFLDSGNRGGEIGLLDELTLLQRLIGAVQKGAGGFWELLHHWSLQRENNFHSLRRRKSVLRQLAGRFEYLLPWQLPESGVRETHSSYCSGHCGSLVANCGVQLVSEHPRM